MGTGIGKDCERCGYQLNYDDIEKFKEKKCEKILDLAFPIEKWQKTERKLKSFVNKTINEIIGCMPEEENIIPTDTEKQIIYKLLFKEYRQQFLDNLNKL